MSPGYCRCLAASITIVALVSFAALPTVGAGSPASWGGRVFNGDRATPREGVVVSLRSAAAPQASVRSEPTRTDGTFLIDGMPSGTYTLAVETEEGVFVSPEPLHLQPGSNTPLALSLRPAGYSASQEHGFGGDEIPRVWEYVVGGTVILFSLFVLHKLFEDSNEKNSTIVLTTG
jgi:hypothetical protein